MCVCTVYLDTFGLVDQYLLCDKHLKFFGGETKRRCDAMIGTGSFGILSKGPRESNIQLRGRYLSSFNVTFTRFF